MSGSPLITMPQGPASPPGSVVQGDGWWPDIDCTETRNSLRVGEFVTQDRLVNALQVALLSVTRDLLEWAEEVTMAGAANLASVTAAQLLTLTVPDHSPNYGRCYGFGQRHRPRYRPARAAWLVATIGTTTRLQQLYLQAVRYTAAGQLSDEYRDMAVTAAGQPRADVVLATGGDYRRTSIGAVRDILGTTHVAVALI